MAYRVQLKVEVVQVEPGRLSGAPEDVVTTSFETVAHCTADSPTPAFSEVMTRLHEFLVRAAIDTNQEES